ncbi:hypothetical protein GEMRC1_004549 [Eukaryota sp. GEM-RC1]
MLLLPNISVSIDYWTPLPHFRYRFLSNYASDNIKHIESYTGTIFCSTTCANLLQQLNNVPSSRISILNSQEQLQLDSNFSVHAFDSNHSPGSLMFCFYSDETILVTCYFRFLDSSLYSHLNIIKSPLTELIIDNQLASRLKPMPDLQQDVFPLVKEILSSHPQHTVLFDVESVGYEPLMIFLVNSLDLSLFVTEQLLSILQVLFQKMFIF